MKPKRKGEIEAEGITTILLWIVFIILAGGAVYLLVRRLTG